jgi:hypothetical protein
MRRRPEIDQLWYELHDTEQRVGRLEGANIAQQAKDEGIADALQKKYSRKQKIIVTISSLVAIASAIVTIVSKIHGL